MRGPLTRFVSLLAVVVLGLTAGAMLAEAAILVPFWRSLSANQFYDWYAMHNGLLVDFYSPLEIASATLALVATGMYMLQGRCGARTWAVSAVLSIGVLASFFVYFQDANASFAKRSVLSEGLSAELVTWGRWQWARVAIGVAAFTAGVCAHGTRRT